jgi:hypothetical protein
MALVSSRTGLNQGAVLAVAAAVFATGTGADIRIHTSLSNTLPALAASEFFEVRDHSLTQNNGLYQVVTVTTSTDDYECNKVTGAAPAVSGAEAIKVLGATGVSTEKSVHFDTPTKTIYVLEQGNVDVAGVTGQAFYSFCVQEWKDDEFIIANGPFPMLAIDADAGKYVIGQDPSGNNNGWVWADDAGFSIQTRKLMRNMGWNEVNAAGVTLAKYVSVQTLGVFEDPATDTAYYQFGTDTTVDDTVNFTFAGAVNEAVKFFEEFGNPDTLSFATTNTITRATGSFITDGYKVGGQVTVRAAETPANNGTHLITGVAALTLTLSGTPLTIDVADVSAQLAVDNDNAFTLRLRVRDGDPNGKVFAQANIASAGKVVLSNFIYAFPLANSTDLNISVTDVGIDANSDGVPDVSPYSGMSIEYFATPQARAGLVGGSFNFGIIVDANNGTAQEVYEFVQWSLRSTGGNGTGDIDSGAETAIGRTMDGLMRFVGPELQVGSTDGGLTFPTNPDGGGSGVFIDNLNAVSTNDVVFYDNLNAVKAFPETIAVTLDFNQTIIDDTVAEFDLFYDRTIRTNVTDFVLGATAGPTGTITSAGTNLPNNAQTGVGSYIRVSGLTGGDAAMNGVYQITTETTPGASWAVIRYDNATIVAVTATTADCDQNCVDTPDAIIVDTNVSVTATTISFTTNDTIGDTGNGFGVFAIGDIIRIEGTASNDGVYEVETQAVGTLTTVEKTITTEAAGASMTITKIASGIANADFVFSYDFDGNTQGGRTVSTTTSVKAKAVGAGTAQPTESTVQQIVTGTPLTIPLVGNVERNYA